jgi:RNA binding exosome subunit
LPVKLLELRVYSHATEDKEKVVEVLRKILGEEYWRAASISEEVYSGHYGNPVIVITAKIQDPEVASRALDHILERLGRADRGILAGSLEERVDRDGTLYFRVSKQDALLGKLIVYEADDVVRIAVRFAGRRRDALREYKKRLEELGE